MNEEAVEVAKADGRDFITAEDVAATQTQDRPEWLPEKYKTGEDLAKAYKELESRLGRKDEDARAAIMEELQAEAFKDRPETAGDYQLPDFIDSESSVDNGLLKWWSEHAFENGYSQKEFEQGIEMYAQAIESQQPDLEAEMKRLGDNANIRVDAASAFARKMFSDEQMPAIERLFESADGVMVMETIMEALKDGSFASDAAPTSGLNEAKLNEMMRDPRYWNAATRDPHFVKEVNDGWSKLYRG